MLEFSGLGQNSLTLETMAKNPWMEFHFCPLKFKVLLAGPAQGYQKEARFVTGNTITIHIPGRTLLLLYYYKGNLAKVRKNYIDPGGVDPP